MKGGVQEEGLGRGAMIQRVVGGEEGKAAEIGRAV